MTYASDKRGFTMLELLLVVVIILIASGLAVPSFIRSYRGAKLRTSARAVVMSHRYARAMAVLKQTDVAILYDVKKNNIEIVSVASTAQGERDRFLESRDGRTGVARVDEAAEEESAAPEAVITEQVRALADGVRIEDFESEKVHAEKDGIYWVRYFQNGMCDPYELTLRDEYEKAATIEVDPISGKAMVKYD